jgi:hypothetical protein
MMGVSTVCYCTKNEGTPLAVTREYPALVCTAPPVTAEVIPQAEMAAMIGHRRLRFTELYLQLQHPFRAFFS